MVSEKDFGRMLFLQIIFDTSKQSPKVGICKDTIEIESYQVFLVILLDVEKYLYS